MAAASKIVKTKAKRGTTDSRPEETKIDGEVAEYSSHKHQFDLAAPPKQRVDELTSALTTAFKNVIQLREVPFIVFDDLTAMELAEAFMQYPIIIKPTLSCVNVAQRAISRDLNITFDTYGGKVNREHAAAIAGYVKALLPPAIAIPALLELDRYAWTDKEMRALKGNWEKAITLAVNSRSGTDFRKRYFEVAGERFEIDAGHPSTGKQIEVAIDIKRIESSRDIHKRADEIINKATKFKTVFPKAQFIAVIYYPFPTQHGNVTSRLKSDFIDNIFFAGESESSIITAVEFLLGSIKLKKKIVPRQS